MVMTMEMNGADDGTIATAVTSQAKGTRDVDDNTRVHRSLLSAFGFMDRARCLQCQKHLKEVDEGLLPSSSLQSSGTCVIPPDVTSPNSVRFCSFSTENMVKTELLVLVCLWKRNCCTAKAPNSLFVLNASLQDSRSYEATCIGTSVRTMVV